MTTRRIEQALGELLSGEDARAEAAARLLAGMMPEAFPSVMRLLQSDEPEHRWWGVRTLAETEDARSEWFLESLKDANAEVRAAAALALAAHPGDGAILALVQALSDEDSITAVLAVNALIKLGNLAVPALVSAYDDAPRRGQIHILRALAELRDPRAIQLLLRAQGEDSAIAQYWAQQGLEKLGMNMVYLRPD